MIIALRYEYEIVTSWTKTNVWPDIRIDQSNLWWIFGRGLNMCATVKMPQIADFKWLFDIMTTWDITDGFTNFSQ